VDFSQDVLMLFSDDLFPQLNSHVCQGVLIVAEDLSYIKRRYTYSALESGSGCGEDTPVLWISERTARRLLKGVGQSFDEITEQVDTLESKEIFSLTTSVDVSMAISGAVEDVQVVNVIGHLPGTSADQDDELIIVAVQYDSSPIGPDGVYPAANDNASGVAVMLEIIKTLQESGYQPFKTFLFVAYSGEGMADLSPGPLPESFLDAKVGFLDSFNISGVIYLRGMAVGQEDTLAVWSQEISELAKTMESAVHLSGLETERVGDTPTMNFFPPKMGATNVENTYSQVGMSRFGWERSARFPTDTVTFVRAEDLQTAGQAVALGLMILGR
jgi:hypothetical protein